MQLTIREMTRQASSPRFWAGLLCVVCILTVSAPFSSAERFNGIQRFFYWGGIAISTYFCATFILFLVVSKLKRQGKSEIFSRVFASIAAGISVAALVFFIDTVVIGFDYFHWKAFVLLSINCILITLAISTMFFIVNDALAKVDAPSTSASEAIPSPEVTVNSSPFYQRLSKSLGTDVISLQAQDHYVDVRTTLGNELILIRLSDAIKELGEDAGLQVHRSWWVTTKHMVEQKRIDNKQYLVLSNGSEVPVSRTYSAGVKAALA